MSFPYPLAVVKVGGSLFDHPALAAGLRTWLAYHPQRQLLIIPGGGALADMIRRYHRTHGVSEEACHWLAIQAMHINAGLLRELLPQAPMVHLPQRWPTDRQIGILNAPYFTTHDETQAGALPHTWRVTSDAIAARVAEVAKAPLIMLKSVELPDGISWSDATEQGLIDPVFGEVVQRGNIDVTWLNFRRYLDARADNTTLSHEPRSA
jgi:aspartokinase-like uncharacterized kinase